MDMKECRWSSSKGCGIRTHPINWLFSGVDSHDSLTKDETDLLSHFKNLGIANNRLILELVGILYENEQSKKHISDLKAPSRNLKSRKKKR
jgi:hypothetical protein